MNGVRIDVHANGGASRRDKITTLKTQHQLRRTMEHRQFMPLIDLGATLAMKQRQWTNTVHCISLVHHEQGHHQFKKMILHQFNEIRLVDDSTKVNYEQVSAINRFSISDSPMQNLSGRPGTGKSTIQHILVCEYLLQPGSHQYNRKVLYLATTQALLDEAREEIKSILMNIYGLKLPSSNKLIADIDFINESWLAGSLATCILIAIMI